MLRAVAKRESHESLSERIRTWRHEPTRKRLALFAEQARALATRVDKGELSVRIEDAGIRLPAEGLCEFWSTFVHVIRNAVDHGLESPEERRAAGKSESGVLTLSTRVEESMLAIRVADDGRGIDWGSVSAVAKARGLPAATHRDLEEAIFSDGLSTKGGATELSGRGVGLSAVRAVVSEMGGSIQVQSAVGQGTEFTFLLPLFKLRPSHGPSAAVS
jgi:two-component system chemotaxis sensor kinase CheA